MKTSKFKTFITGLAGIAAIMIAYLITEITESFTIRMITDCIMFVVLFYMIFFWQD